MKELLEESLLAFNQLENARYEGKYKNTYELASAISKLLKVQENIDEYSSAMFTQLKLDL